MTFRVGQKVVCVNAELRGWMLQHLSDGLVKGKIYTIRSFDRDFESKEWGVRLVEITADIHWAGHEFGFYPDRFRPLVEKKTSIEIFQRMLLPTKENA